MITLKNVNKYFNRRKQNEIHVINNTSLELPETGIVTLLGPSGCGKTTLLNAIGGLDKINSGKIYIDDQEISGAWSNKKDKIRNAKIGYIFQNFNLIDNRTVFENVAIALKMVGVKDKDVIQKRVNYCLEAVGIYQYRFKKADALSGGQRQRVAIARAIVKNPRIIIADEPTGNLDSANTLEVMNIIKTISKDRLVLLVTHERKIAEFYSERIIEMKDGEIIADYANDSSKYLDYQLENKIYLKDLPIEKKLRQDGVNVDVYSDEERDTDIKIVLRGSNLYINTEGRLNVVDESSNIEMIDDHYTLIDESIYEDNKFKYGKHLPENFKAKYTSLYTPWNMIGNGFKTISNYRPLKKVLLIGFLFAAMFAFLAVSNVMGIFDIKEKDFLTTNEHYITVSNPKKAQALIDEIEAMEGVRYAIPGTSLIKMTVPFKDYYQTSQAQTVLNGSLTQLDTIEEGDLIHGRMPESDKEIVVDKMILDRFTEVKGGIMVGVTEASHFLDRKAKVPNLSDYTIVGISDTNSPSIYINENQIDFVLTNASEGSGSLDMQGEMMNGAFEDDVEEQNPDENGAKIMDYRLAPEALTIKKGVEPTETFEAIMINSHDGEYEINKNLNIKMAGEKLKLVGFYSSDSKDDIVYVTADTVMKNFMSKKKTVSVYAEDTKKVASVLEAGGYKFKVNYDRDKDKYKSDMGGAMRSSMIVAGIILLVALIEMFLMLRSSFLSRIKEVGIMRAIGLKKKDIYRMFAGEIIDITFIMAIPGILLMYYILSNIVKITPYLENMYMLSPAVAGIAFAVILIFNLLAGLLPVYKTLRKTPAAILSRTDI